MKASGTDMATIEPEGHPGLDLGYLRRLRMLRALDDGAMVEQLRTHLLRADSPTPSIEALVHAFLPGVFIDHTHADAVLLLTNRDDGQAAVAQALGSDVIVVPYVTPGFKLALAAAEALESRPEARGMVWAHHGIVTWGDTARESYEAMIELVSRAEAVRGGAPRAARRAGPGRSRDGPRRRCCRAAPPVAPPESAPMPRSPIYRPRSSPWCAASWPRAPTIATGPTGGWSSRSSTIRRRWLRCSAPGARETLVTPPLTTDHLIRTKPLPLWIEGLR